MENLLFNIFMLFVFVVVYVLIGRSLLELFDIFFDLKTMPLRIVAVMLWPILFIILLMACVCGVSLFILGVALLAVFLLGVIIYDIIRSLIKGEKIDWNKELF